MGKKEITLFGADILFFHPTVLSYHDVIWSASLCLLFLHSQYIYLFKLCKSRTFSQRYRNLTNVAMEFMINIKLMCFAAFWILGYFPKQDKIPIYWFHKCIAYAYLNR